jgi:L-fuconolactonase
MIDAHVHFWRLARGDYDWLTPQTPDLYRDFEPSDVATLHAATGITGLVAVQAAETVAETQFLLDLAARYPQILGVVGWVDFGSDAAPATIAALATNPLLKGLRPMLQDLPDDDFVLRPSSLAAIEAMHAHGLSLDALVRPRHLRRILVLRERYPELPIVIDHAAKPEIANRAWEPWASDLRALAADGVTCCKLSGLVTEAAQDWSPSDLKPYVDLLLEAFGPERMLWGSDWPVVNLAGGFTPWREAAETLIAELEVGDRARVFGANAANFYHL